MTLTYSSAYVFSVEKLLRDGRKRPGVKRAFTVELIFLFRFTHIGGLHPRGSTCCEKHLFGDPFLANCGGRLR